MTPLNDIAGFEIRALATRDSLSAMTRLLHRAYAPLAARGINVNAATQDDARTRERTLTGQTFVAMHGRALIGTITVCSPLEVHPGTASDLFPQYSERSCCRFHQFAVDPDWTGRGLAQLLVRHAEEWALARGYRAMAADMADSATELCGFYRHMGYRGAGIVQMPDKAYRSQVFRKDLHPSPLRAPLLTMARHHLWSTRQMLAQLALLDDAQYFAPAAPGVRSIHDALQAHLAFERDQWWARIGSGQPVPDAAADADADAEIDADAEAEIAAAATGDISHGRPRRQALAQHIDNCATAWHGFIDALPEERLHGQLRHLQGEREPDRLTMAEALMQVFAQASHRCGQLSTLLELLGRPAAALDLVVMLREEAAE